MKLFDAKKYTDSGVSHQLFYRWLVLVCLFAALVFQSGSILASSNDRVPPGSWETGTEECFRFSALVTDGGDFVLPGNRKQKVHQNFKQHQVAEITCYVIANTWSCTCSAFSTILRPAYYTLLFLYHLF